MKLKVVGQLKRYNIFSDLHIFPPKCQLCCCSKGRRLHYRQNRRLSESSSAMVRCRPALLCNSDRFPFQSLDPSKAKLCKPLLSKPFCQLNRPIVQHCLNHDYCSDQCLFSTPILQLSRSGHIHSLTIGLVFVRSVPFWFRSKILCPPLVLFCSKSPAPCFDLRIFDLSLF